MMPATAFAYLKAIEDAMAKAPTPYVKPKVRVKAQGIPIGNFDVIADEMGRMKIKPKRKPAPPHAQYAAKHRKRYKGVAK